MPSNCAILYIWYDGACMFCLHVFHFYSCSMHMLGWGGQIICHLLYEYFMISNVLWYCLVFIRNVDCSRRKRSARWLFGNISCWQWLKWFCEAGGGAHLTKPGWSKPHTHSNPTNLALFRHKITLYRFNQGAHTIAGGLKWEQGGWAPLAPLTLTTTCWPSAYLYLMFLFY